LLEAYLKASRILTIEYFSWDKLQQFFRYPNWCALLLVLDYESLANNFSKEYQTWKASMILTLEHFGRDKLHKFVWHPTRCALHVLLGYKHIVNNCQKHNPDLSTYSEDRKLGYSPSETGFSSSFLHLHYAALRARPPVRPLIGYSQRLIDYSLPSSGQWGRPKWSL
jgi:hypothetical protein